jgi:ubiquinone/menaquinone biosynthesis C-methylase UbiE
MQSDFGPPPPARLSTSIGQSSNVGAPGTTRQARAEASMAADNAIPIEAWNTILFEKFCRFRYVLTHGLSDHSDEFFRRHQYATGTRVLDIGCGFGDTTQLIARQVGPAGEAVGVDCAPNFIAAAIREAREAGVNNAAFLIADVQADDLRGPYDAVFSRFGTMFFNLPGAALRNIRKALRPDGELVMIVWRRREDNPWVHKAEIAVREIMPVVSHEETDQVHCGPGPFSMAEADLVSDMLRLAGFCRIGFERCDTEICIGRTLDEAVEFAMALGPAGEMIRLAGDAGQNLRPRVADALRATFAEHLSADGVWLGSSSWFIAARNSAG